MKQIVDVLLSYVPEKYRWLIPAVFAVVLAIILLAPQVFGSYLDEIKSISLTAIAPTQTAAP